MHKIIWIGCGGFAGAICRFLTVEAVALLPRQAAVGFPLGTLTANLLGCFLIGLLHGIAQNMGVFTAEVRSLVFIGFLGSYTTFSTFAFEAFSLGRADHFFSACLYVSLHVFLGLAAVWLGQVAAGCS